MTRIRIGWDGSALSGFHLFAGLSAQELDVIASRGALRSLRGNSIFIQEGDESSSLYLILSGKVEVFRGAGEEEKVLRTMGPDEYLGEVALLGDSVRTASARTREDSTFLELSRRAFLACLYENPQIALNLDDARVARAMHSELGDAAAARYCAWSSFRRSGLPLILLIGGCTGSGKSTVAAELSLRLDIGRTQSTDILREVMRLLVPAEYAPELHVSTYSTGAPADAASGAAPGQGSQLIDRFRAQVDKLAVAVDGVINRSVKEGTSTIIEGIHIHPAYHEHLDHTRALLVPVLLTIPSREELKRHFARRGQQAPARNATRYLEHFESIWRIQTHLIEEAAPRGVPVIPNIQLDETVRKVMDAVSDVLLHPATAARDT